MSKKAGNVRGVLLLHLRRCSMKRPTMDASSCLCFVLFLDRTQRLKEAKQEATKEIEDLKQLKLGELAVHETQVRLP